MKTTVQINLGGYPFVIDDDAYARLSDYIHALKTHFDHTQGADEIVGDIESRMAEIISDKLGSRPIVSLVEVNEAIAIMGTPKDFGIDDEGHEPHRYQTHTPPNTAKKLYRSTDDRVLGGVCSGLAAYFGIAEPLWLRLLFAFALLVFGVGVIPYILLWILLPPAKTSADKLAMRGEPINVESIAKTVSEEIQNLGEQLGNWKNKPDNTSPSNRLVQVLNTSLSFVGEVIFAVIRFISKYLRLFIWVAALALLFFLGILCVAVFFGATVSFPFVNTFLIGSYSQTLLLATSGFFIVFLPLLLIIWLIIQAIYRKPTPIAWIVGGTLVWFGALSVMGNRMAHTAEQFNVMSSTKQLISVYPSDGKELKLQCKNKQRSGFIDFGNVHIQKDHLASSNIELRILKSADSDFRLEQSFTGYGANQEEATQNIERVNYALDVKENEVAFDNLFYLSKGQKFRNQKMEFDLSIPVGGSVFVDEYMVNHILDIDPLQLDGVSVWDYDFGVNPYLKLEMTEQGLKCSQCPKIDNEDESEDEDEDTKTQEPPTDTL